MQPAMEEGCTFVTWIIGGDLDGILCELFERIVGNDNCINLECLQLQIPADYHRCHYVKVRYLNGTLAVCQGPRKLARFPAQ